jgi:hypothetical protein
MQRIIHIDWNCRVRDAHLLNGNVFMMENKEDYDVAIDDTIAEDCGIMPHNTRDDYML